MKRSGFLQKFRKGVFGSPSEGQKYISASTANGSSGGSVACVEETFQSLRGIA